MNVWTNDRIPAQDGKLALITGANSETPAKNTE